MLHTYDPIHKSHRDSRDSLGYIQRGSAPAWYLVTLLSLVFLSFFKYMYGCFAGVYTCVPHAACGGQKLEELDPLELWLQMVVSCCVDAGNRTQVLSRSRQWYKQQQPVLFREQELVS